MGMEVIWDSGSRYLPEIKANIESGRTIDLLKDLRSTLNERKKVIAQLRRERREVADVLARGGQ
jgi:hypothetical protein